MTYCRANCSGKCRMEYSVFLKLYTILVPQVQVNDEMSRHRSSIGSITVEIILHCLLEWLGGGSYLDIRLSAGISPATFYSCIYKCIDAILDTEDSAYKFPDTSKELDQAAWGFPLLSSQGAIKKCDACLDRFLLQIQVPPSSETGIVKAYFSGHYQTRE